MADVYLAIARGPVGFHKLVVLKHLRSSDDDERSRDMFLDEARLAARLGHPNIVDTYDVGQDGEGEGESYFIAMEYLEGQSLSRLLKAVRGRRVDPSAWVRIAAEALQGLHYAHELRDYDGTPLEIVHRDVSPANIFVTYDGEVKILDFGIAKGRLNLAHTEAGVFKGKLGYMAREQARGEEVDRRADVFSMGVVLWEALTERRMLTGGISLALETAGTAELPTVVSVNPEIDARISRIVERAVKRNPEDRFATAAAMRDELEEYLRSRPDSMSKTDLGALVTSVFEGHRTSVQRRIERHLATVDSVTTDAGAAQRSVLLRTRTGTSDPPPARSQSSSEIFWHPVTASQLPRLPLPSASRDADTVRPPAPVAPSPSVPGRRRLWAVVAVVLTGAVGLVLDRKPSAVLAPAPAPSTAAAASATSIFLNSVPAGADVTWNGRALGQTPMNAQVPRGVHTFVFSKSGYIVEPLVADITDPASPLARTVVLHPHGDTVARSQPPQPAAPAAPARAPVYTPPRARPSGRAFQHTAARETVAPSPPPTAAEPVAVAVQQPAEPPTTPATSNVVPSKAEVAVPHSAPAPAPAPGTVDAQAVTATVRAHAGEVRACLDRARMEHPELKGRLGVHASIDPLGRVISASATNELPGGARLQGCVVSAFGTWRFPAPAGGVAGVVSYAFVFE